MADFADGISDSAVGRRLDKSLRRAVEWLLDHGLLDDSVARQLVKFATDHPDSDLP